MDHIHNFSLSKLSFKKAKTKYSIDKYSKKELISEMVSTKSYLSNYRNKIIKSFILFGCWNHIDCCSKNSKFTPIFRDIIIKQAKKEPEKLFIIAGDNWYSQNYVYNNTSYKYYPFTTLTSGYSLLLNNSKKEYDIILGNHDENNDNNIQTDNIHLKKDCMLKVQKHVIENIAKKNPIYKVPSLEELQNISIDNMYINSINMLTCIEKPIIKELSSDVYIFYINTNLFDNYTYKKKSINTNNISLNYMLSYITYITKVLKIFKPKLLFVTGHNPLIAYKKKKYHKLNKIYDDDVGGGSHIMKILINELNKYKTIYLCADIHNFNIALLNKNLGTVISGTGGGSPDIENIEGKIDNILLSPDDDIFNISDHYIYNAYGYTKIKYDNYYNVYVTYKQLFNANKDIKFENKIINKGIKTYKFKFINNENGWELKKMKDRISDKKIELNIPLLINEKKKYCKILKSNRKDNISALISLNQLVKSNTIKFKYLENDKNTPLLCFYKKKHIKLK
tara:strand:+ start:3607 stop:5130 length:1524 start_codon:yes stop_codon:yes gene_type:complete